MLLCGIYTRGRGTYVDYRNGSMSQKILIITLILRPNEILKTEIHYSFRYILKAMVAIH